MAQRLATREDVSGDAGTPGGVAPELNGVPDSTFDTWLRIAGRFVGVARWKEAASDGHALLTAHAITIMTGPNGDDPEFEAGPLMAEANGPASRSFGGAAPEFSDAELATTQYGRLYLSLRRTVRGRGTAFVARTGIRRVR